MPCAAGSGVAEAPGREHCRPTVERGLNEHELGASIEYGIEHPAVRSEAFQPVTHSGRHVPVEPLNRLTDPDVIHLINEQQPNWLQKGDFFPVPCCLPTCRAITHLLVDGDPGNHTAYSSDVVALLRGTPTVLAEQHSPDPAPRRHPGPGRERSSARRGPTVAAPPHCSSPTPRRGGSDLRNRPRPRPSTSQPRHYVAAGQGHLTKPY
jgi:hypothetical protein